MLSHTFLIKIGDSESGIGNNNKQMLLRWLVDSRQKISASKIKFLHVLVSLFTILNGQFFGNRPFQLLIYPCSSMFTTLLAFLRKQLHSSSILFALNFPIESINVDAIGA